MGLFASRATARIFASGLVLATTALTAPATAEPSTGEVALTRDPPFDRWCLAPVCTTPGAPRPIRPPLALPSTRELGLLEAQLRATSARRSAARARTPRASTSR